MVHSAIGCGLIQDGLKMAAMHWNATRKIEREWLAPEREGNLEKIRIEVERLRIQDRVS